MDRTIIPENLHLYLLVGQSNMAGRGVVTAADKEIHPRVFALGKSDEWIPARDPIHFDRPMAGVGPGRTFGMILAERHPNVTVGLIPCAVGGTSISQWLMGESEGGKLYPEALRRTHLARASGQLRGILWHQGENDCVREDDAIQYPQRLVLLIERFRRDLSAPDVPFLMGTVGGYMGKKHPAVERLNKGIRGIPFLVKNAGFVEGEDLEHLGDGIHLDAPSARELGRRFAREIPE